MTDKSNLPDGQVADAPKLNWVDRFAPASTRPYLRLSRADRPIGTWLLLIPCIWGLLAAALSTSGFTLQHLWIALVCTVGAFLMRGAGCTWNDITDREFDGQVERTRSRPIPSGQVTVRQASIWMLVQAAVSLGLLLTLNWLAIGLALASVVVVLAYPFAKRFTWWPQIVLGLAFNWGVVVAWAAATGTVGLAPFLIYAAGIAWTLFYDTIYAHQDKDDDALIEVKSTARLFGDNTPKWLKWFLVATVTLFALGLVVALAELANPLQLTLALCGIWGFGWHLAWQLRRLDTEDPDRLLQLFRSNRNAGLIPVLFLAAALMV